MQNHFHLIALSMIPNVGAVTAKTLISYCGSAEAVFQEKKSHLLKIPGIGANTADNILQQKVFSFVEKEFDFIKKYDIKIHSYLDKSYPSRLLNCNDAPILLFQKGNTDLNQQKIISIVGTRKASAYGKQFIQEFLEELKQSNILVVSGMALGIDGQAHKSALQNQLETVGVLGHGLNYFYPEQNKNTAKDMLQQNGSLLSEYNSQEKFVPANFPKRNRIIAGMADATIVVESEISGGSIITANIANTYNRDVFAVPGRYKDKYSTGCNFLLKTYKANILENAQDLLTHMLWDDSETNKKSKSKQMQLFVDLSKDELIITELLKARESISSDEIMHLSQFSASKIATLLLELELKGVIVGLPGNLYSLA